MLYFFVCYCLLETVLYVCMKQWIASRMYVLKSLATILLFVTSKIRQTRAWNWCKNIDMATTRSFRSNICRNIIDEMLTEWLYWGKSYFFFFFNGRVTQQTSRSKNIFSGVKTAVFSTETNLHLFWTDIRKLSIIGPS